MKKYDIFYFEKFEFHPSNLSATFEYSFDHQDYFVETIYFQNPEFPLREKLDEDIVNNFLFSLHIALGISYYKLYPTQKLSILSWKADDKQILFWEKFYRNWLGEFFYRNNFSPKNVLQFFCESEKKYIKKDFVVSQKALVPVWGGKDSIVSVELLRAMGIDFDLFTFTSKDNVLYQNTQNHAQKPRMIIKRELSKNLSTFLSAWYYNGHVPITGVIAFVMQFCAYLYDYKYLVLSNEKSANFWNIFWEWIEVNHQWSKSYEFEEDFWAYVSQYLTSDVNYFSLLRPFYEIKIAQLFAQLWKKYFWDFSSCNKNFKIFEKNVFDSSHKFWCENCPKCAFVFVILSAFLSKNELAEIFSQDMYNMPENEDLFRELAGISGIKPFECVGTNEEVLYGMFQAYEKHQWENLPHFLKIFEKEILPNFSYELRRELEKKFFDISFENTKIPTSIQHQLQLILPSYS